MIDYTGIKPMMSMPTFAIGFITVLIIGVALVEISEGMAKNKRKKAGEAKGLTPSQRAVQRYYDERRAG